MTLSLPRSILNQADALEAEAESTSYLDGLTKSFGGMMDSLVPKPEIRAPQFPSIESVLPKLGMQEQPVQGPTMDAQGVPQFSLPDDDSFLGTKPKSEYSSALTTLGGTPEAEALTKPGGVASPAGAPDDIEGYIRYAATRRGIDPDIAVRVAMSEGGVSDPVRQSDFVQNGKREESYGPFQLYLGGGLGNAALKAGIDPRNPAQWKQGVDFALDEAAKGGWGPWYGAARVGIGHRQGLENAKPAGITSAIQSGNAATSSNGISGGLTPDQFNSGLSTADAYAACGVVAAVAFARRFGRNPTVQEATELAKQYGWSPEVGMGRGTAGTVDTARALGAAVEAGPVDTNRIATDVQRGNPVGINLGGGPGNNGHFMVAERYDPSTGKFDFGNSAKALKASGGNTWFTLAELPRLGFGSPRDAIYADAPDSPSPSVVAGASDRVKGMSLSEAMRYGSMAMEDMSGRSGGSEADGNTGYQNRDSLEMEPGTGIVDRGAPPIRDIRGDYAPRAVEPDGGAISVDADRDGRARLPVRDQVFGASPVGDIQAIEPSDTRGSLQDSGVAGYGNSAPPVRDDYRLTPSPPAPGGAVEPAFPDVSASTSEAPASSGADPWQRVGYAIRDALTGANNAVVGALNRGADAVGSIFEPRTDLPEPPARFESDEETGPLTPEVVGNVIQTPGRFAEDQGYKFGRLQQLNAKRVQGTITPDESNEARELSIELSQWAVPGAPMELRGVSRATREAVEGTFAGGPRAARRTTLEPAPASGIVSRAQADEAVIPQAQRGSLQDSGQSLHGYDRYYHGTAADFDRLRPSQYGALGEGVYLTKEPVSADVWATSDAMRRPGGSTFNPVGANVRPVDVPRDLNLLPVDSDEYRAIETMARDLKRSTNKIAAEMGYDGLTEYGNAVVFPESLDKIRNATAGTRGGLLPETPRDTAGPPTGIGGAAGRALGAGLGAGYEESQREGSTAESVVRAGVGGAATSVASSGAGRFLRPGRRPAGLAGIVSRETDAFSPRDPNETYDLRHKVVDIGELVTSHGDDFKPNPRFPSELQPRLRDRAAAAQQVNRIASELNPDALLTDTRSIQTGSPIVGPDNIVESGNGRVMALRQAIKRNPEAAARYREEIAKIAADYGIDPSELQGKRFPVLVRERLSDVDRKAFAREANESSTAVVSGFERSLGDAELLTDDLIQGLTVAENQSIDQALSAPANRGILRAFTQALPQNEAGTMVDAMGNLSEEGVRRVKQALIIKAYGNSVTGQRMARSMIESIDPGVKNVETAIYGSLPSIARVEAVSKRGDLSISTDIAKAADMYARLKQNSISVADYMAQGSLWERETTPVQDTLIQAFEANKRSSRRIRDILEGYADRAEPQANPSQGDLFGGQVARASKEDILDSAIQDFGGVPEEAASTSAPAIREGLDGGQPGAGKRVPEYRESGAATATLDAGARPPTGPVRIGSGSLQPELPGSEPSRGLYVGEARRRTQKRLDDAMAKGEPITLSDEEEIARLRLDKFPEEMRPWMAEAAKNADWFREQRRGVVPDVVVQESAAKMWASIDDAIKRGAAGKAYNPEETVALRNLLRGQYEVVQDYARRLSEPLTKPKRDQLVAEQLAEAQKLTALFQVAEGARAEAGRSLRQYREYARSLKDNPEEAGLRYIKARFGSMDGAEKVVATYTQMVQDGASPVELAAFLRNVRPAWMDRLNIIRYGSMLSSTTTHLRNITGNVINIGQDIGLKPLAVGIDVARAGITGGQRTRYMGEVSEMARGMLEGTSVGLRDMWTTLRTGVNPNEIQTIDNLRGGFASGSGKLDALVESPLRALSAADAFFRGVTMGGHSRAVAFRKASQEGLTGAERADRVQDIVENLHRNLDVLDEASKQSARDILQEDRGAVRAGMQLRESMNGLVPYLGDVVVPFVRTPINIAAQGLEMSPAGFISVIKDARAGNVGDATDTAARALFGTALMVGAGSLAMNGMMTGGYPEDARTRSTLPPGWQPYSLKLGDRYIQYSNLGPFGIPIATAVVLAEAQKQGKPIASGETVMRLGKYMGDQTFMRGVSDFVKAFNDPSRYGENVVENIGTQFAPFAALGRQIERAMGMAQKDPHGALEALYATYPMTAGRVADRTDSRGQPVMPNQTGVDAFISPTNVSREQPDQVLTVLRKSGIGIGAPPKNLITPDGRSVELTPRQKQQFQQLLYSEIQQNLIDFNDPSEAERAMGRARARARESMLMVVR